MFSINITMNASIRPDINYLNVGTQASVSDSGTPNQVITPNNLMNWDLSLIDGSKYASIVKLTSGIVFSQDGMNISQGLENSVDINNHANVLISGVFGTPDNTIGDQIISVKGGSTAIIRGYLSGRGKRNQADILIDNWSDQSFSGSTVNLLALSHTDGKKIRVVLRYGASKVELGEYAEVMKFASIKMTAYWWIKYIVRKIMRIPLGTKGPSFL